MADANERNSPKTLLQHLDSRPEFPESGEHKAFADHVRFILNSHSKLTGEFDRSGIFRNRIHRSTKYNQSSSTSSTSSKLPVKMKRSQPTVTNCYKRSKTSNVSTKSTSRTNILQNGTARYVQAGASATLSVPVQESQGIDEQVVFSGGSSADGSGYPEYTTLWIPD